MSAATAFLAGSLLSLITAIIVAWEGIRWATRLPNAVHTINGFLEALSTRAKGLVVNDIDGRRTTVDFEELQRAFSALVKESPKPPEPPEPLPPPLPIRCADCLTVQAKVPGGWGCPNVTCESFCELTRPKPLPPTTPPTFHA